MEVSFDGLEQPLCYNTESMDALPELWDDTNVNCFDADVSFCLIYSFIYLHLIKQ